MSEDKKGSGLKDENNQDEVLARCMFMKASCLSVPLILASFAEDAIDTID